MQVPRKQNCWHGFHPFMQTGLSFLAYQFGFATEYCEEFLAFERRLFIS